MNRQLPGPLRARVQEYVSIGGDDERDYIPDIRINRRPGPETAGRPGVGELSAAEPVVLPRYSSPRIQRSVHVLDVSDGDKLVTVIEVLSPANKVGKDGRRKYRRKQVDFLNAGVSLVEIDLIRAGRHIVAVPARQFPRSARTRYRVCVVRGWATSRGEVYPIRLRDKLPVVRIPLRKTDPDALLDLQAVIEAAYTNGSYESLDYSDDPEPMFGEKDESWAGELLRAAGKR